MRFFNFSRPVPPVGKYLLLLVIAWVLGSLFACRSPYDPPALNSESLLVVEGRLTDDTSGSEILISQSQGLAQADTFVPFSGALVSFEAEDGLTHQLRETVPGRYISDPSRFMPELGKAYRLSIISPDNGQFLSSFETMKAVPPINRLEAQFGTQELDDPTAPLQYGLLFTLDTEDPSGQTRYYQWEWEETYEFFLSYSIYERYRFDPVPEAYRILDQEETRHCWRFGESQDITVASSRRLTEDRIVQQPLHFIGAKSGKINWTYSLQAKQYALSEAEFTFWSTLKENTETTGSLFDPIPSELRGNIQRVDAPGIPVIGYFGASRVSTKRIFVSRQDFPDSVQVTRPYQFCFPDTLPLDLGLLQSTLEGPYLWLDTAFAAFAPPGTAIGFITILAPCGDCKLTGSPIKPSFWP